MKQTSNRVSAIACVVLLVGTMALSQAGQVGKAVVRSVRGAAQCSEGGTWKDLQVGQELRPGTVLRTANDSSVDLYLDQNGPLVRLMENTTLGLDKLSFEGTGVDTVIETQLDLKSGRIVGITRKLSATSKYEIKTPNGVAGIRGTDFVIGADGSVNVLDGQIVVVFVKADGSVVTQVVNKGEMFNPASQKVEPIPADQKSEYEGQLSGLKGVAAAPGVEITPPYERISPVSTK